jgi:hypothetical protein
VLNALATSGLRDGDHHAVGEGVVQAAFRVAR